MITHPRARPGRLAIAAIRAAALLGVLVLVAACGSSSSDQTERAADQQQALAFARCMRANGVPDFPDPDPDGRLRGAGHEQQDNPTFRAAMQTCRGKLPGGGDHR